MFTVFIIGAKMLKRFKDIKWDKDYPRLNKFLCKIIFGISRLAVGCMAVILLFNLFYEKRKP